MGSFFVASRPTTGADRFESEDVVLDDLSIQRDVSRLVGDDSVEMSEDLEEPVELRTKSSSLSMVRRLKFLEFLLDRLDLLSNPREGSFISNSASSFRSSIQDSLSKREVPPPVLPIRFAKLARAKLRRRAREVLRQSRRTLLVLLIADVRDRDFGSNGEVDLRADELEVSEASPRGGVEAGAIEEGVWTEDRNGLLSLWVGRIVDEGRGFGVGWGDGVERRGGFEE